MKKSIALIVFTLITYTLLAVEVGGHITENTTWIPDNNPYSVVSNIFIEEGLTLTILPGTHIELGAVLLNNENYVNGCYFMLVGEESTAKMFWVNGRIIAEGTEQDSIVFTRDNNLLYNHWGTIYFDDTSQKSSFSYCKFEYSSLICLSCTEEPKGALSGEISDLSIKNCTFKDNYQGMAVDDDSQMEIINNSFYLQDGINPDWMEGSYQFVTITNENENPAYILMAGNLLPDSNQIKINNINVSLINNTLSNIFITADNEPTYFISNNQLHSDYDASIYYDNQFSNYSEIYIDGNNFTTDTEARSSIYCQNGIISNNTFTDVRVSLNHCDFSDTHIFRNNIINGYRLLLNEDWLLFNNILDECYLDMNLSRHTNFYNCFLYLTGMDANYLNYNNFCNCAVLGSFGMYNIMFRNCITTTAIATQNSAGGNIQTNPHNLAFIYEDYFGQDYHLSPGSIAIDAGFDTLSSYYHFDLDYSQRIWDGDGNGTAIIDIGPYEFSAPALGGIEGIAYNPINGEPVDYALIKINNENSNFTFTNNIGNFTYALPAGIYDVYAERMYYENAAVYQVEVVENEVTLIAIPMSAMVDVEEYEIPHSSSQISNLSSYPNPFNPSTTIKLELAESGKIELAVYNIKGQKVKTLMNCITASGIYEFIWNGKDEVGKSVGSGQYVVKLLHNRKETATKIMLLK